MSVRYAANGFTVLVFPADDDVLRQHVAEILDQRDVRADAAIELLDRHLGSVYPSVTVRRQTDLAGLGEPAVYVFRDGAPRSGRSSAEWIHEDATARVV